MMVRRMQMASLMPSTGAGWPSSTTGPKSKRTVSRNGEPVARTRSSRPHRASRAVPAAWMVWPDRTSLGNVARSTTSTRRPRRARSMAVGAPAQRLPMTMASYMVRPLVVWMDTTHRLRTGPACHRR